MSSFPFDIVGFDLDGTLLNTHVDIGAAVNHALAHAGRASIPVAVIRGMVGGGAKKLLARALDRTGGGVTDELFLDLHHRVIDHYEANIAVHSTLFPGGEAMLDALAERGAKLAVVTNKLERLATKLLAELGLSHRFFAILGGDTLGPGKAKPAPDLLHEMVRRGGGGRAVYVGDTTYDTGAARAAGMPCIAVSFGFNDMPAGELGSASVIHHFDELIPALATL